jgi:ornithine cyclodeaminase/alanine dehydrogenase-like protein (mu-crystallin family)
MTTLRVIDGPTVERLLPYPELIDVLRSTMIQVSEGTAHMPLRSLMTLPGRNERLGLMQGYLAPANCVGVKLVSLVPDAAARGQSSHLGLLILYDADGLRPVALLSGSAVTARRTAAASAVATAALARSDARVLAVLGTGEQAAAHIEALTAFRVFEEVRIWGRRAAAARALADQMAARGTVVRACESVAQAVDEADVVCTTTSAQTPILPGRLVRSGTHVNLVGSSTPDRCETDDELVRRAAFFVDSRQSALHQAAELLGAIERGVVKPEHIRAEIGEVLSGASPGRTSNDEVTVYKSLGVVAQDIAAARLAFERAEQAQVGPVVNL